MTGGFTVGAAVVTAGGVGFTGDVAGGAGVVAPPPGFFVVPPGAGVGAPPPGVVAGAGVGAPPPPKKKID